MNTRRRSAATTLTDTLSTLMDYVEGEPRPLSSTKMWSEELMDKFSRRLMMRIVTYGALAGGALAETGSVDAATKIPQVTVGYQSKPMGAKQCSTCKQYEAPSSCKVIDGVIAPDGWCRLYAQQR
jgi:hypothetical protein